VNKNSNKFAMIKSTTASVFYKGTSLKELFRDKSVEISIFYLIFNKFQISLRSYLINYQNLNFPKKTSFFIENTGRAGPILIKRQGTYLGA